MFEIFAVNKTFSPVKHIRSQCLILMICDPNPNIWSARSSINQFDVWQIVVKKTNNDLFVQFSIRNIKNNHFVIDCSSLRVTFLYNICRISILSEIQTLRRRIHLFTLIWIMKFSVNLKFILSKLSYNGIMKFYEIFEGELESWEWLLASIMYGNNIERIHIVWISLTWASIFKQIH